MWWKGVQSRNILFSNGNTAEERIFGLDITRLVKKAVWNTSMKHGEEHLVG